MAALFDLIRSSPQGLSRSRITAWTARAHRFWDRDLWQRVLSAHGHTNIAVRPIIPRQKSASGVLSMSTRTRAIYQSSMPLRSRFRVRNSIPTGGSSITTASGRSLRCY